MRGLSTLLVLGLAAGVTGCGSSAPTDEHQVRDVLATFARATEGRDYRTLCDRVLAPKLLSGLEAIGLPCEVALQKSLGDVEQPKLTVGTVTVTGTTATADVRTVAEGQPPSSDRVRLVKIDGAWRISALGEES